MVSDLSNCDLVLSSDTFPAFFTNFGRIKMVGLIVQNFKIMIHFYLKSFFFFCLLIVISVHLNGQNYQIQSPDGKLQLLIEHEEGYSWQLQSEGQILIEKTFIDMHMSDGRIAGHGKVVDEKVATVNELIKAEIPYKDALITDHYNLLKLQTDEGFELEIRVYDDGFAYRFIDNLNVSPTVMHETMELHLADKSTTFYPKEDRMYSHNERSYLELAVADVEKGSFCSLPVLFQTALKTNILFTETALHHYPNMFLEKGDGQSFISTFPKFVLEAIPNEEHGPDRNEKIIREAEYIAKAGVARDYPWRVFITGDDKTLVESNLAYQLAKPNVIKDIGWIKPGKVAWDWYNANNIFGVNFASGLNTSTYKYYIDFAAANGIEYVILDEGWTKSTTEIMEFNPEMDVKELIRYAENKGVGIILWVLWKPLNANISGILTTYKSWGAKGIKVDFMQRSDQEMVTSYEEIAKEAARLQLLVDFHGAYKPSGLQRTYPNVLNFEGVKGAENNKWSDHITPDHNLTIPFIRMAAGPMDYTPGAMVNAGKSEFAIRWERPMSQGTRCHQVAMYVVYEAPLQMMCESPSIYLKEQETVDFITEIPTVWDETKVIEAKIGDYLIVARRKGKDWYIGGMTDWTARKFDIPLHFLSGSYDAKIITDGMNADRYAEDYHIEVKTIKKDDQLRIKLASGGGFAVILKSKE